MALSPRTGESSIPTEAKPNTNTKKASYCVMATTPIVDLTTGDYIPARPSSDDAMDIDDTDGPPQPQGELQPFVKSLLFKKDLQSLIQRLAGVVRRELDAGQGELIFARWLAVSKNWSTVAVCQNCLDMIAKIKDTLVNDASVRLVQTAAHLNPDAVFLSQNALVVHINPGTSHAKEFLTVEDDCAVMIPLIVPENVIITGWDRHDADQTHRLHFSPTTGFVVSGRTFLCVEGEKPFVCLVFSMAAMKEASYSVYQVSTSGLA